MKYRIFLSDPDTAKLEFEVVSQELRVYLTRLLERNDKFGEFDLIHKNWVINRSRNIAGLTIYVLEADDMGGYEPCEFAWHFGEFEIALRRNCTAQFIELLCEIIERDWLELDEVNSALEMGGASFRIRKFSGEVSVEVFSLDQLEEDAPDEDEHPNIRILVKRMENSLEQNDYPAVLHASASIFETLAKDVVPGSSIQDQTLGSFFQKYQKHTQLPPDLQKKVIDTYNSRGKEPLSGHGSVKAPNFSASEAVSLCELTR